MPSIHTDSDATFDTRMERSSSVDGTTSRYTYISCKQINYSQFLNKLYTIHVAIVAFSTFSQIIPTTSEVDGHNGKLKHPCFPSTQWQRAK